jgi:flagellar hook-associated protein 1 FlgK
MSSSIFNIGLSGLNAAQRGLTVTGDNISNASTPGYSVQSAQYQSAPGQYTGSGFLGSGVQVTTVTRGYSTYLSNELNNSTATGSALSTYYTQLSALNNMVGDPTGGLSTSITGFFSGMQAVANNPSDPSARSSLISDAQTVANQLNMAGQQYAGLRAGVNTQISGAVNQINTLSAQIAELNVKISSATAQGGGAPQSPNQLLDQRDQAVATLNTLVGTSVVKSGGNYSVFIGNGTPLVVGTNARQLTTASSPTDPSELTIAVGDGNGEEHGGTPQYLSTANITGGTLGGLLQFRSQSLDPAQSQLGSIAATFAGEVNAQNGLGLDLNGKHGGALLSVPAPEVYSSALNAGSGKVTVAFTDPSKPTASDYDLTYEHGAYTLTDASTGAKVGSFAPPGAPGHTASFGGLKFTFAGTPKEGDSYAVYPTRGALNGFSLATTNGSAIAAAAPVVASAAGRNTGTATITQGTVTAGYTAPASGSPISVKYDAATSTLTLDPPTDVTVGGETYAPGAAVPYSTSKGATLTFNGITVTLSGKPADHDTFNIAANGGTNDGRNALQLANLVNSKVMAGGSQTLTTAYAHYVNEIGNQTNSINASNVAQAAVIKQITAAQQSVSGVNLDEEAANLIKYQQMYQANSKVISTANTLFETLLNI